MICSPLNRNALLKYQNPLLKSVIEVLPLVSVSDTDALPKCTPAIVSESLLPHVFID